MRLVRVFADDDVRYGLAAEGHVTLISDEPFAAWETDEEVPFSNAKLLAPVVPTKIVCAGVNYRSHAEEMALDIPSEPVIFLKPPTAVNGPDADVVIPEGHETVDYEGELAVVVGRRLHKASPAEVPGGILGYTCANDITVRSLQRLDGQWTRAKGFDGFCPMGPWVESDVDPRDLLVETYLNGERVQSARTSDMLFDPFELVGFVSHVMTLLPGDVVLTGTPSGVGPMRPDDVVEVRIEGVGSLVNHVASGAG